jgi:hypothetical protein
MLKLCKSHFEAVNTESDINLPIQFLGPAAKGT